MATEFGTRLRAARREAGMTQQEAAKATGIPQSTISTAEREGTSSTETTTYALAYKVNAHWLATGDGEMRDAPPPNGPSGLGIVTSSVTGSPPRIPIPIDLEGNPDYPAIRRVRFKLSAGASGFGVEYQDAEGAPIVFQRAWFESRGFSPAKLFAVRVANGSMEPGLHDGDTVVVNTEASNPKDGVVYAVNYEGEMVVKRLVRDAGQWWLSSDNMDQRRYPRKVCDEQVFIIGEVVHKQSERI